MSKEWKDAKAKARRIPSMDFLRGDKEVLIQAADKALAEKDEEIAEWKNDFAMMTNSHGNTFEQLEQAQQEIKRLKTVIEQGEASAANAIDEQQKEIERLKDAIEKLKALDTYDGGYTDALEDAANDFTPSWKYTGYSIQRKIRALKTTSPSPQNPSDSSSPCSD